MLANAADRKDLGANDFDYISTPLKAKRLVTKLESLGYKVDLQPMAAAA